MAEELLNAQDKKYGIGHAVDPVFFDCGEAFSQLTDRSVKTRWDMRHIPASLSKKSAEGQTFSYL